MYFLLDASETKCYFAWKKKCTAFGKNFFYIKEKISPLRYSENFLATLLLRSERITDTLFLNHYVANVPFADAQMSDTIIFHFRFGREQKCREVNGVTENLAATLSEPFYSNKYGRTEN